MSRWQNLFKQKIIRNLENTSREPRLISRVFLMDEVKKPGALVEIGFLLILKKEQG